MAGNALKAKIEATIADAQRELSRNRDYVGIWGAGSHPQPMLGHIDVHTGPETTEIGFIAELEREGEFFTYYGPDASYDHPELKELGAQKLRNIVERAAKKHGLNLDKDAKLVLGTQEKGGIDISLRARSLSLGLPGLPAHKRLPDDLRKIKGIQNECELQFKHDAEKAVWFASRPHLTSSAAFRRWLFEDPSINEKVLEQHGKTLDKHIKESMDGSERISHMLRGRGYRSRDNKPKTLELRGAGKLMGSSLLDVRESAGKAKQPRRKRKEPQPTVPVATPSAAALSTFSVPINEAARLTGYDRASLVRMARTGKIPGAVKNDKGSWLIPHDKLPKRGQRGRTAKAVGLQPAATTKSKRTTGGEAPLTQESINRPRR